MRSRKLIDASVAILISSAMMVVWTPVVGAAEVETQGESSALAGGEGASDEKLERGATSPQAAQLPMGDGPEEEPRYSLGYRLSAELGGELLVGLGGALLGGLIATGGRPASTLQGRQPVEPALAALGSLVVASFLPLGAWAGGEWMGGDGSLFATYVAGIAGYTLVAGNLFADNLEHVEYYGWAIPIVLLVAPIVGYELSNNNSDGAQDTMSVLPSFALGADSAVLGMVVVY